MLFLIYFFLTCNLSTKRRTHGSVGDLLRFTPSPPHAPPAHVNWLVIQSSPQTTTRPREASNQAVVSARRTRDPVILITFASSIRGTKRWLPPEVKSSVSHAKRSPTRMWLISIKGPRWVFFAPLFYWRVWSRFSHRLNKRMDLFFCTTR